MNDEELANASRSINFWNNRLHHRGDWSAFSLLILRPALTAVALWPLHSRRDDLTAPPSAPLF
jgi:hypothetical protein